MNLLVDQREIESATQAPTDQPLDFESVPLQEEPPSKPYTESPVSDYYDYERPEKGKSYFFPIFLIILLIAAIAAATYFGFFYKPGDLSFVSRLWKKTEQPVRMAPEKAETTEQATSVTETAKVETAPATVPSPAKVMSASGQNSLLRLLDAFSNIMQALPAGIKLGTLFMDEGSFSLEISSAQRSDLERAMAEIKQRIPCEISLSPATAGKDGGRALLVGTFPATTETVPVMTQMNTPQLIEEVRRLAKAADLSIIDITPQKSVIKNDHRRTPIFIKVRGNQAGFVAFCRQLGEKNWGLQVAKLIMQAARTEGATFVLRLEMVQPL